MPPLAVCVLDILQALVTREEKRKTLLRAEIFAGLYLEEKIIEQIFWEVETMLNIEESAGYQRIFKKGVEKGIQQGIEIGIEKGIEKGMKKGRQETLRESVLKLLHKKFKKIPHPYVDKIKSLDEYALGGRVVPHRRRFKGRAVFSALDGSMPCPSILATLNYLFWKKLLGKNFI